MKFITWLTLGRVSNLPSVWTNVLAAVLVAQTALSQQSVSLQDSFLIWAGTLLALSLMYIGGMFLNDAFDAEWDREHKVARPIALGEVSSPQVWLHGGSMLCLGIVFVGLLYQSEGTHQGDTPELFGWLSAELFGWLSADLFGWLSALGLAGFILLYNYLHKGFALAPVLMGMCRFGVYFVAALLLANITAELLIVACGICAYICGVTYSAKNEHINQMTGSWSLILLFSPVLLAASLGYQHPWFWLYAVAFSIYLLIKTRQHLFGEKRNIGAYIGGLLAGIPLLDGLALASMNLIFPSLLCFAVFLLMPQLQRLVSAT